MEEMKLNKNMIQWDELDDFIGKPVFDKDNDEWRILKGYQRMGNDYSLTFTDTDGDFEGMYGIYKPFIVNITFNEIHVMSALCEDKSRNHLIVAEPMIPRLNMGYDLTVEEMIILLSTSFIPTENTMKFINSLSSLRVVEEVEFNDDGVGQTVTAKKGASMNAKFQVQPIVKLQPIRTYAEIEQVESKFLFRVNKDGTVCLREADGGQWKYETQKRIVAYLEEHLKEEIETNQVVVIG